ncbi:baseplate protein [Citrobacter portucalensis]|uniref:baseplate protein n=1 Tax=Citrobacter portucalensis TaxID=1639133 RepID=UPI00242CFB24|nr:baseplate protein [Citrobacter portucalensis]WFZ22194.1 baseplate protein [Citrobacter portucalensis]
MAIELVSDSGWRGARLPEIRGEIYASLRALLKAPDGSPAVISSDGDSVIGQLIATCSEEDLQIIEAMGWLFGGFFISQGESAQLDGAGEWLNVTRYGMTQSSARVVYLLEPDGVVNAGDSFEVSGIEGDWIVATTTTADPNSCTGLVLVVKADALVDGNTFVISVNGTEYTTQFEPGDTSSTVIARLYGLVIAGDSAMTTMTTAYGDMLFAADGISVAHFSYAAGVYDVIRAGMPVTAWYDSETVFPVVDYGDMVSDDVLVLANGGQGFLIEGDESYRARLKAAAAARKTTKGASRPGIKAAVLAVEGVSFCSVNTNRGIDTDENGLPGKSVQVFVAGGSDNDVAQAIYDAAAGEACTFGGSFGVATDGDTTETIYFTRQAYQSVYVAISGAVWDVETTGQPADYYSVSRAVTGDYFTSLIVSRDVYAKQIEASLMVALPTLTDITVSVGVSANPSGRTVPVSDGVIAVTNDSFITIEGEQ